ncbi:MAG: hypothetical protein ACRD8Z_13600 [Nitrososphaeraceae archaeon]
MTKGNKARNNIKRDNIDNSSNSYFATGHRKRKKRLLIFVIPILAVIIAFGIYVDIQAREQGLGADMVLHLHPNLTLIVDGSPNSVPKNIGIDAPLYKDHSLDKYGMTGMAPIHTHDSSGVIHVESNTNRNYTLDEFLDIWGLDLNNKAIQISANGKPVNSLDYILNDGDDLIMEIKQQ